MTKTDTIARVPRPRGVLPEPTRRQIERLAKEREEADSNYRAVVVLALIDGASFNEVSKATGLSKDTLQRWKREAGK